VDFMLVQVQQLRKSLWLPVANAMYQSLLSTSLHTSPF
jgi:hypothetical protein